MRRKPPGHIMHWKMGDGRCHEYVSLGSVFIAVPWFPSSKIRLNVHTPRSMGLDTYPNWHAPASVCELRNPFPA